MWCVFTRMACPLAYRLRCYETVDMGCRNAFHASPHCTEYMEWSTISGVCSLVEWCVLMGVELLELWSIGASLCCRAMDSSAFEHVFVGEVKNGEVIGFHNWLTFCLLESKRSLDYHGYHVAVSLVKWRLWKSASQSLVKYLNGMEKACSQNLATVVYEWLFAKSSQSLGNQRSRLRSISSAFY